MKEAIVGLAMLLLLIIFPLQNALDVINGRRMEKFDIIVYKATQTARTDGYFTPANIASLRNDIKTAFPDVNDSDIVINVTTTPRYRLDVFDEREVINYEISVPIEKVIATADLLGINPADNRYRYTKRGYVLSEVLMP